ncbi:tail-specific protease, partial [Pseudomonas syringae pv. tagetis]
PKGSVVRLDIIPAWNAPNHQTSKIVAITREAVILEEQAAKKSILHLKQDGEDDKLGVVDCAEWYRGGEGDRAGEAAA